MCFPCIPTRRLQGVDLGPYLEFFAALPGQALCARGQSFRSSMSSASGSLSPFLPQFFPAGRESVRYGTLISPLISVVSLLEECGQCPEPMPRWGILCRPARTVRARDRWSPWPSMHPVSQSPSLRRSASWSIPSGFLQLPLPRDRHGLKNAYKSHRGSDRTLSSASQPLVHSAPFFAVGGKRSSRSGDGFLLCVRRHNAL
jgi:hypothetical protein